MSRNVTIFVSSENDGTTRNNVPDWLIHATATWVGGDALPHSFTDDDYFLLLLNWLKNNYPADAKQLMQSTAVQILRLKHGLDTEFHQP